MNRLRHGPAAAVGAALAQVALRAMFVYASVNYRFR